MKPPTAPTVGPTIHDDGAHERESLGASLQREPELSATDPESQLRQLQEEELALTRQWLAKRETRSQQQRSALRKAIALAVIALMFIMLLKYSM